MTVPQYYSFLQGTAGDGSLASGGSSGNTNSDQNGKTNHRVVKRVKRRADSELSIALYLCLCVVASLFVVLAIGAFVVKNKATSDPMAVRLEEAMKLGATFYPMVFAALMSRALKSIGRYHAERGIGLTSLWSLMNCRSVFDPIVLLKSLPTSFLSWALLAMWIMSPLGSQASLRLMHPANLPSTSTQLLRYMDTGPAGHIYTYNAVDVFFDGAIPSSTRDAYTSCLMQSVSTKASPRDQWGNVKIPFYEALDPSQASDGGWISTGNLSKVESYTSLVGLPVAGLPTLSHGTVQFSVETAYIALSCPTIESITAPSELDNYDLAISCLDCDRDAVGPRSNSFLGHPLPGLNASQLADASLMNARTIELNSTTGLSLWISRASCQVTQRLVETMITCENATCTATKIRPSTTDNRGANFTSFNLWATDALAMISDNRSISLREWAGSSQLFLNDTSILLANYSAVDLSTLPPALFAQRASILLNTAIQVIMAPTGFTGELPTNLSLYGPAHIPARGLLTFGNASAWGLLQYNAVYEPLSLREITAPFVGASTNATVVEYNEVYQPSYAWVALLLASSAVLFFTSLVGLVFTFRTLAPNIFDPVIGLTYDNPYLPVATEGSPVEVEERAKELGGVMVRVGNAHGIDDAVGKIALGIMGSVQPLREGNTYA